MTFLSSESFDDLRKTSELVGPVHTYEAAEKKRQLLKAAASEQCDQGPIYVHFFPRKITFRGKFRGISWKKNFLKLFQWKIPFFPNIFW
jgi:hypothetical protein